MPAGMGAQQHAATQSSRPRLHARSSGGAAAVLLATFLAALLLAPLAAADEREGEQGAVLLLAVRGSSAGGWVPLCTFAAAAPWHRHSHSAQVLPPAPCLLTLHPPPAPATLFNPQTPSCNPSAPSCSARLHP